MLDEMTCSKCKEPMQILRTDGIPFCAKCDQIVRKEAVQKLMSRKGRENRPKLSMREWRYVPR